MYINVTRKETTCKVLMLYEGCTNKIGWIPVISQLINHIRHGSKISINDTMFAVAVATNSHHVLKILHDGSFPSVLCIETREERTTLLNQIY